MICSLDERIEQVISQADEAGIGGETITKLPGLSVVLVSLREGSNLDEHAVDGPATVQVLQGHVALNVEGEENELRENDVAVLAPKKLHDVQAQSDSVLLVTFGTEPPSSGS